MSALAEARPTLREVAADLDTALARPDWRQHIGWPVSLAEANSIGREQLQAALRWTFQLNEALVRDACLLALPVILSYARAIALAAIAVERAAKMGIRLAAVAPEFAYLHDGNRQPNARTAPILLPVPIRLRMLRRAARVRTWTVPSRLPRALLHPDVVAVSHNELLCAEAARADRAVGFQHAESILERARERFGPAPHWPQIFSQLAPVIVDTTALAEPCRSRALDLLDATARPHLQKALADMAALRAVSLPRDVWSGSGGLYAPRAVGLEILRRKGSVTRFDHGTPREFVATAELTVLLELSVSSEFVLATAEAAAICQEQIESSRLALPRPVAIRGGVGDPIYARVPVHRPPRQAGRPLRVVYAPTQLLGFRQLLPALPPDTVYLDWQMRVAKALRDLDVHFICQAHPEGLFKDRPHPLAAMATTLRGNFDVRLRETDVFVFDCPTTTALWQAACTDARIVFLDIGAGTLTPAVARLFAERATVIPVAHDQDNRLLLDGGSLRAAVLDDRRRADPTAFRRLLAREL